VRKIPHLLLPRAGPGASHANAHPNRLPKLRPHRRHVSDVAAYLGVFAVRARGLHQARQPGEIADRDAGGEGGRAGCVGSLRSDGGPNQGRSVERSGCMPAAAMRRPHDDQCSAPPRTRPATGGAVPCLGCSPTGCVPKHVFWPKPGASSSSRAPRFGCDGGEGVELCMPPARRAAASLLIRDKAPADRGEHRQAPGAVAARLIWRSNRKLSPSFERC
jgi:hypothetical protein